MNRTDFGICVGGQKPEQLMLAFHGIRFRSAGAMPSRPDAGEDGQRPVFTQPNHVGVFRGLVSAYSQNDVKGHHARVLRTSPVDASAAMQVLRRGRSLVMTCPNCGAPIDMRYLSTTPPCIQTRAAVKKEPRPKPLG
jgi:hypothetical protein